MSKKSKQQSYTVINSPELAPYQIYVEENQFTVVQPCGNYEKTYGYFSRLSNALQKITQLKVIEQADYSLEGYINRYEAIQNNLLERVKM